MAHELAEIKRKRDLYKRDWEKQIQEYHETLAKYETQVEAKIEEFAEAQLVSFIVSC